MPRYEVIDPTGEGFYQLIDTKDRTGPFNAIDAEGHAITKYGGKTYTLAVFSRYCKNAGAEAQALANKLNRTPPPQAPEPPRFVTQTEQFNAWDTIKSEAVATFRTQFLPNAQQECDELVKRLNGLA
jgi:hypothetical protein